MSETPSANFAERPHEPAARLDEKEAVQNDHAARDGYAQKPLNMCSGCGYDFASLSAFDAHRTGSHRHGRRCLTDEELRARGYTLDRRGRWRRPASGRAPWM